MYEKCQANSLPDLHSPKLKPLTLICGVVCFPSHNLSVLNTSTVS
jgi:hypothetical protein